MFKPRTEQRSTGTGSQARPGGPFSRWVVGRGVSGGPKQVDCMLGAWSTAPSLAGKGSKTLAMGAASCE